MVAQELDRRPTQGAKQSHDRIAGQGMRVVGLVEKQEVTPQRMLRHRRRGVMTMTDVAHDHRRPKFGERISRVCSILGAADGQRGAKRQAACQGKAHQRQKQQAQDGTLNQG